MPVDETETTASAPPSEPEDKPSAEPTVAEATEAAEAVPEAFGAEASVAEANATAALDADTAAVEELGAQNAEEPAQEPRITAVDTGRRIDPAALRDKATVVRRDPRRPGPERPSEAPSGGAPSQQGAEASGASEARPLSPRGAPRADGPRADGPRPDGPRRDGPRGDRPRGDGPPRGKGRDGPRRDGPRRDGPRDATPRGPAKPRLDFSDMAPIVVTRDPNEPMEDFAAMLAETGPIDRVPVRIGDRVKARCVHIGTDTAFFELSRTQEASMPLADLLDDDGNVKVRVGDRVDAFVVGLAEGILLSTKLGKDQIDVGMLETARSSGMPVQGTVTGVNKGGIEVTISGSARGFCPLGQIDANFVEDPASLIGKTLSFLVKEVKEGGKNILLSRRALVEKEKKEKSQELLKTLAVGQQVKGTVTRTQPFGAFVDIGGIDGLVPMSELGWGHVKDVTEVLKVGDEVLVEVKRIEEDPRPPKGKGPPQPRISLSLKSTQPDPFIAHLDDMKPGTILVGVIKKLETFGAFVELFPGVQGLVHISEIADRRINHPKDVLNVDEHVQVRVLDVDEGARRIALSCKEAPVDFAEAMREPDRVKVKTGPRVGRGAMVEGAVERVERFGLFVKLDPVDGQELGSAFLPISESGTPRGSDVGKLLPVGTKLQLLVIEVDDRGRLKVSRTAREQAEERELIKQYGSTGGSKSDKGDKGSGLGTFGDLLKAKFR